MQIATVPMQPELLADGRRTRSRSTRSGSSAGCRARARCPAKPPLPNANIDCTSWKPVVCDTDHGSIQSCTRSCTWPNSWYATTAPARNMPSADDEVRPSARWRCRASPRTPRRTAATTRGPSGAPSPGSRSPTRAAAGRGASGRGGRHATDVAGAGGEQLALVDEVRGEEDRPAAPWPLRRAGSSPDRRAPRAGRR